jgi:OmcA/MtrC family decaheme c-type cytochrome
LQAALNLFTTDPVLQQSRNRPVANGLLDVVNPVGGGVGTAPTSAYPTKNVVTTAACNGCHDPLAIHGGGRREVKFCQVCHNAKTEIAGNPAAGGPGWDNTNLVKLVHGVHRSYNLGSTSGNPAGAGDFSEVTYPQDIRNCTTCHQGGTNSDNWKTKPTITGCTSCHYTISFVSPAPAGKTLHSGGSVVPLNNSTCAFCHPASGGLAGITDKHATENVTPNNSTVPGTLKSFEYGINSVTVASATNVATIKFWIKQDNVFLNLGDNVITRPSGFSGGPSFLFAYALPQDNVAAPADYNNRGRTNGQPETLSIVGLPVVAHDNTFAEYTVTRTNAFPAGAIMRAVALQGYFTQISGGPGLDNVGRHTFSVVKNVTGDAVRRVAVESGYTNNNNPVTGQPLGCLQCHEIFEGHGGNRVSNAQVCVMCHNPNMTSSARTFAATPVNPDIVALYGTDPLQYPEVSNNFKELIHGLHGASKRTTNFVDIRNFRDGVLLQGDEITYPGNPMHCGKCHLNNLYQNIQTTGRLLTTAKTTTGVAGETVAQINAARASVPNATDLVNTPAASACGHCHDSVTARSHFVAMGGEVRAPRGTAVLTPPTLGPDVLATP